MRMTGINVVPADSANTMVLSLRDPRNLNPIQVVQIEGLAAEDIMKTYSGRGASGNKRYNMSLRSREVVILIGLNPRFKQDETYSDLRDDVYRLIHSSRTGRLELHFMDGEAVTAYLSGSVTNVEASLFEQKQVMKVTIECDYPMLKAPVRTVLALPTGNVTEFTIEDTKSTAQHGFVVNLAFTGTASTFRIDDDSDDWFFEVRPATPFAAGDELILSSEYGEHQLYLVQDEELYPIADAIVRKSSWPVIFPGPNEYKMNRTVHITHLGHSQTYWGV